MYWAGQRLNSPGNEGEKANHGLVRNLDEDEGIVYARQVECFTSRVDALYEGKGRACLVGRTSLKAPARILVRLRCAIPPLFYPVPHLGASEQMFLKFRALVDTRSSALKCCLVTVL